MAAVTRSEHDLLGVREVPAEAYWGVHTLRASENFPITGTSISAYPHLIDALAAVKEAAALANEELGLLEARKAAAIVAACREIRSGKLHDQFVVDVIHGGAGTSTNMNANEVIANRALELLGRTQLQDAVPMALGQEFSAYAVMVEEDRSRLAEAVELIHEINLGATAIGTG